MCDVSQKFGFSKAELINALSVAQIEYIHIPELGISSNLRQDLKTGTDYYNLLKHYESDILPYQRKNLELLKDLVLKHKRVAITCFEAKISHCHRSKIAALMSKESQQQYVVSHI